MTHKANCRIVADVISQHGVQTVVCSPGSRNAPLIIAIDEHPGLQTHVVIDERSAAFVALGIAQVTRKPVALVCTSGTALLNYAPAIAEAYYQALPLIVLSADRLERWIDQDDSQTLRQPGALANFVKKSCDLPDVDIADADSCLYVNRLVNDAMIEAITRRHGPVHINVRIGEPLTGVEAKPLPQQRIIRCVETEDIISKETIINLAEKAADRRIMIVAGFMLPDSLLNKAIGRLVSLPNVCVMHETISNLHLKGHLSAVDVVLSTLTQEQKEQLRPDIVISLGGALVSRQIKEYLRSYAPSEHWSLGHQHTTVDCFNSLTLRIEADPGRFLSMFGKCLVKESPKSHYNSMWEECRRKALQSQAHYISNAPWSDMVALNAVFGSLSQDVNLQLSNGTSIRYAQLLIDKMPHGCYCNRGVSGIDGSVSTAVGASLAYPEMTLLITGDMSLSYDIGALSLQQMSERFKIVVLNNKGGGIFRFIPSTSTLPQREHYFCAAPTLPIQQLAEAYGFEYMRAENMQQLIAKLPIFMAPRLVPSILEIVTDPEVSAAVLKNYMKRN